ncbi:MAG TPA: D-alanyl-D-alanine carboxypeptidase/D-alanyl-D-alanine-endopeptidase [Candidatus Kapabacteria bacterium]
MSISRIIRYPFSRSVFLFLLLFVGNLHAQLLPDSNKTPLKITFTGYSGDTSAALRGLRKEIADLLPPTKYKRMFPSCKVVLINPDSTISHIHEVNASQPVLPASVEKLFTTSTILWALGSDYQFKTRLEMLPSARLEGSSVIGNVYLRPSGDPTLKMSDFDNLARFLKIQGVTQIEGDIISDLSVDDDLTESAKRYFATANNEHGDVQQDSVSIEIPGGGEEQEELAEEEETEMDEENTPGFFSEYPNFFIDRNVVTIRVDAGAKSGARANVSVYPPIPGVRVINKAGTSAPVTYSKKRVKVGKGKKARWKTVSRRTKGTYSLRISTSAGKGDNEQVVVVTGLIPARSCRNYNIPIKNVPLAMAGLFKWRLEENGVRVTGNARTGKVKNPNGNFKTLVEKNTPLLELLKETNKRSDNYLAESMFRKLSAISDEQVADPKQKSIGMMNSWMNVLGISDPAMQFDDGSGLSRKNFQSANSVIELLYAISKRKMYSDFASTMSVAGIDGTTRGRMINTYAWNNAHSKTGTLNGVTALGGYVATKDGQLAAFFITMQSFGRGASGYKRIQDAIVQKLAAFSFSEYEAKYKPAEYVPVTAPPKSE